MRISRDDENLLQSESIVNQRDLLRRTAAEQGWEVADIYIDDGYSGTNFDRPGFLRMLSDIEAGKIDIVLVKDLSRLGRDYIDTGYYVEKYFPAHGVRFIAVNDGIDTFSDAAANDMGPFRQVLNDMYARDISKKVRSVMDVKRKNGKFIGAFAPYGYVKSDSDRNCLEVDTVAAATVKHIFELYADGLGYMAVAAQLNSEGVLPPSLYKQACGSAYKARYGSVPADEDAELSISAKTHKRRGKWSAETIRRILTNPTYAGDMTQCRMRKLNYKIKKLKNISRENWIVVRDTHVPIIERKLFDMVQRLLEERRVYKKGSTEKGKEHT